MGRRRGTLTLRREDGRIVCESVDVADSTFRRLRGLLGRRKLTAGEGMVLRPAWSIHTAFMHFPIDVVFVDAEQVVMRVEHTLRPFKTASCRGAREVVELAAGECERRGLAAGDRVAWASRSVVGPALARTAKPQPTRPTSVLVASADQRFVKLASFLLESRDMPARAETIATVLGGTLEEADVEALILDVEDNLGDGLRALTRIRAQRPGLPVVVVGEPPGQSAPQSVRVYNKWNEAGEAIDAVARALAEGAPAPS